MRYKKIKHILVATSFMLLAFFITSSVQATHGGGCRNIPGNTAPCDACGISRAAQCQPISPALCNYQCNANTNHQWECTATCNTSQGWFSGSCPAGQTCETEIGRCDACDNNATCRRVVTPTNTPIPPSNTPVPLATSTPVPTTPPQCDIACVDDNTCPRPGTGFNCNSCRMDSVRGYRTCQPPLGGAPSNTPVPPATSTPQPSSTTAPTPTSAPVCVPGQACSNCNGDPGRCYPDCSGGWCNGGFCNSCSPEPEPPPPVPPTATPSPIQPTAEVSMPVTPTPNPSRPTPTGTGGSRNTSQRWVCLKALPCSNPASGCSGAGTPDHRVRLSIKTEAGDPAKPLGGKPTYVFECLQTPSGNKCTTGVLSIDQQAVGSSSLPELASAYGYVFDNMYEGDGLTVAENPIPAARSNNGDFGSREWESYTENDVNRMFLAMNDYDPNGVGGVIGAQQQGILPFIQGGSKKCVQIRWDPYGEVSDKWTLKSVSEAEVLLYRKDDNGEYKIVNGDDVLGGIQNPVRTDELGKYNFHVPDGVYRIEVKKPGYSVYKGRDIVQKDGKQEKYDIRLQPQQPSVFDSIMDALKDVFTRH